MISDSEKKTLFSSNSYLCCLIYLSSCRSKSKLDLNEKVCRNHHPFENNPENLKRKESTFYFYQIAFDESQNEHIF